MILLSELNQFISQTLQLDLFPNDPSNNALQIEGASRVRKIVTAVDSSLELFERCAANGTDFIFVHHGISWGKEPFRICGINRKRVNTLLNHNISLYAVHLPLDAHEKYGNNALLSDMINLTDRQMFFPYAGCKIGIIGHNAAKLTISQIAECYNQKLNTSAVIYDPAPEKQITKVAVISGGSGLDGLLAAHEAKADLLITGEFEHIMYHYVDECKLKVISLGHYASETVGVRRMSELFRTNFDIESEFIDLPTLL